MFKKNFRVLVVLLLLASSCKEKETYKKTISKNNVKWKLAQDYYLEQITTATDLVDSLKLLKIEDPRAKPLFFKLRAAFKKAEPYAGVLNSAVTHRANGPALPIYNDDSGRVVAPIGLQKLEETLFTDGATQKDYLRELYYQNGFLTNLKVNIKEKELTPKRFFIGTHQQLMRITSLALAGFDTPVTGNSIAETAISLESLYAVYKLSLHPLITQENQNLDQIFTKNIKEALVFITKNSDFTTFDRYTFIREYLNPITRNWVKIRQESGLWDGKTNAFPYNFDAPTFFEEDSFNVNFFLDVNDRNPSKEKVALGKKLFFDKKLSETGTMSCATCHLPSKGYTDGLALSKDNKNNLQQRNTPTLLNSIYQKAFFWDGRANTIENQISAVFKNDKEFNTDVHRFSGNILKDTAYITLFKNVFGTLPKSNKETVRAISIYVSTLNGFNSKFDKDMRGETSSFTLEEKNGFNLFMGKALCATCHFIPLTNGTVPPYFNETEKEVIGVPKTSKNKEIDTDRGFYWVFQESIHDKMFKTPTIRNIDSTGPYMHNGIYNTLEEVINFYNLGGGAGLGFDLEHQTLPFNELNLTDKEQKSLVAFMHTLTDTSVSKN
ncbi:cytochrome-c peroxidase [Cellulophaga sp. 20_2_10]|uniref:cytochrome-c peroxidase n=1 Tax=Cellulophaga sp. 20_2_10 TaxID=2942476 RepID=UPI00201A582D|nr:cytochrome c peroxidase [Cellulophaga sp. 20_2_10]MCL5247521.1 cytochrome-c peroxidase [Cellulophaga sp. 20_2_10]